MGRGSAGHGVTGAGRVHPPHMDLHACPTLGTPLAPSMQASLSKVRALRKESAAAHDYNDYGGPTHVRRYVPYVRRRRRRRGQPGRP